MECCVICRTTVAVKKKSEDERKKKFDISSTTVAGQASPVKDTAAAALTGNMKCYVIQITFSIYQTSCYLLYLPRTGRRMNSLLLMMVADRD